MLPTSDQLEEAQNMSSVTADFACHDPFILKLLKVMWILDCVDFGFKQTDVFDFTCPGIPY